MPAQRASCRRSLENPCIRISSGSPWKTTSREPRWRTPRQQRRATSTPCVRISPARAPRLQELQQQVDADVRAIADQSARDVAARRARRVDFARERAGAAAAATDEAVALMAAVLRTGAAPGGRR